MSPFELAGIVSLIIVALFIIFQCIVAAVVLLALRKLLLSISGLTDKVSEQVEPISTELQRISSDVAELSGMARDNAERIDATVESLTTNVTDGGKQVSDTLGKVTKALTPTSEELMQLAAVIFRTIRLLLEQWQQEKLGPADNAESASIAAGDDEEDTEATDNGKEN